MNDLQTGEMLDGYRIERKVARSGMATIYRALHLASGRAVAIKIPHPEIESDPVFFERFHREAEVGQKLDHPGIVKVLAPIPDDQIYLVMQWVDGRSLRTLLGEHRPFPRERALTIALRIADALRHMHSVGVAHRDLKPENILVDDADQIKIIDFGLAASLGARRLTFAKFSQTMGTPDYIAPEQVRGQRGDGRSDLYALGVMLYEMLTGKLPFRGSNPFAIMNDRLVNPPIPPREADPDLDPHLEEILLRALERDPAHRYASAAEMMLDLEHPERVTPRERARAGHARKRVSPQKRQLAFYLLLASLPILLLLLLFFLGHRH